MANPTIIIDAGHGGYDNGAFDNGRLEKDDNLRLALAVGNRLEAAGFPVLYTRTTDVYQRPIDKARIANESGGDYFVSFHRNSSPERNTYSGVQTLVFADEGIKGQLARNINAELGKVGFNDLGVPERTNLVVLKRTQMPAVLIETGFINTDADNELFDTRFDDIADAIARAIEETVGEDTSANSQYIDVAWNDGSEDDSRNSSSDGVIDNVADNVNGINKRNDSVTGKNYNTTERDNTDNNENESSDVTDGIGSNSNVNWQSVGNMMQSDNRYGVQVGLYSRYENAVFQAMELEDKGYSVTVKMQGPFFAVVVGDEDDLDEAIQLERTLRRDGYDTLVVEL